MRSTWIQSGRLGLVALVWGMGVLPACIEGDDSPTDVVETNTSPDLVEITEPDYGSVFTVGDLSGSLAEGPTPKTET